MKKYWQHKKIHSCTLNKQDLVQLANIIKKGFPKSNRKEDFNIKSNLPNMDIYENDIGDFFNHEEIPNIINSISIEQIGWNSEREIDKHVGINFYDNRIILDVDGFDEEWVLGKLTQIQNFLKKKRTKLFFLNSLFPFISILMISLSMFMFVNYIENYSLVSLIFSTLTFVSMIILTILFLKNKFLPYSKIIIVQKKINKEDLLIWISALGLFIAFIRLIISLLLK